VAETLPPEYFNRLYASRDDPWNFLASDYEAAKYQRTLAALTRGEYTDALEIGCSIGVLTARLAKRCARLLAIDGSELALVQARRHCVALPNVEFRQLFVPAEYPQRSFDLTVVSEIAYYLALEDLEKLALRIRQSASPEGQLLLVHWLGKAADNPLTGDQVHEYFLSLPHWDCISHFKAPQYRIELLQLKNPEERVPDC
jgi:SAM-dependent methyltransferase